MIQIDVDFNPLLKKKRRSIRLAINLWDHLAPSVTKAFRGYIERTGDEGRSYERTALEHHGGSLQQAHLLHGRKNDTPLHRSPRLPFPEGEPSYRDNLVTILTLF